MRLPWQKEKNLEVFNDTKSSHLKSMLGTKANQSTGSYVLTELHSLSSDSDLGPTASPKAHRSDKKKKKKKQSSDEEHQSDDSLQEPLKTPLAKTLSKSNSSDSDLNPKAKPATPEKSSPAPPNRGRRSSVDATHMPPESLNHSSKKEEKSKHKENSPMTSTRRKSVSWSKFDEVPLPDGSMVLKEVNLHEPGVNEVPYHKRGKQEYRERLKKKQERRQRALETGEVVSDSDDDDDETNGFHIPALRILNSSDDAIDKTSKEVPHVIKFLGPVPQTVQAREHLNITLQNISLAKYSPEIRGVIVFQGIDVFQLESNYELKVKVRYLFDDWDSKQEILATKIDRAVLGTLLKPNSPPTSPRASNELPNANQQKPAIDLKTCAAFSFNIGIHSLFLPSLYGMLQNLGMNTNEFNFQVDGILVLKIYAYKTPKTIKNSISDLTLHDSPQDTNSPQSPTNQSNSDISSPTTGSIEPLHRKQNLKIDLDLEDQLLLGASFDVNFSVEKNPAVVIQSQDLLHPTYGKD